MKKYLIAFSALVSLNAFSQKVDYKVEYDNPVEPKLLINLRLLDVDLNTGIQNLRTDNTSINTGIWGYYKILDPLEVELDLTKSYLALGKLGFTDYPGNTEISLGSNFFLTTSTKVNPKTKVVLKSETKRDYRENKDITTTTFIKIPAKRKVSLGVRGGLYYKSGPFNYRDYAYDANALSYPFEETRITSTGLYAGLIRRSVTNIAIRDDKFGKSINSRGFDLLFDVMLVPVNTFKNLDDEVADDERNVTQEVKDYDGPGGSNSPLGFRVGYKLYQVEKKKITGKKFGISSTFYAGYKPFQGWFIQGGLSVTLVKVKSLTKNEK